MRVADHALAELSPELELYGPRCYDVVAIECPPEELMQESWQL